MAKLDFDVLWREHPTNRSNQLPCRLDNGFPSFKNQCAIRMGIALKAAGVTRSQMPGPVTCGVHPPEEMHFLRAAEVARQLDSAATRLGFEKTVKLKQPEASNFVNVDEIFGRRGAIYIADYWARTGESNPTGDHIDLWNGYSTSASWLMEYFSWLGYYGGYHHARQIWFWPIAD